MQIDYEEMQSDQNQMQNNQKESENDHKDSRCPYPGEVWGILHVCLHMV